MIYRSNEGQIFIRPDCSASMFYAPGEISHFSSGRCGTRISGKARDRSNEYWYCSVMFLINGDFKTLCGRSRKAQIAMLERVLQ